MRPFRLVASGQLLFFMSGMPLARQTRPLRRPEAGQTFLKFEMHLSIVNLKSLAWKSAAAALCPGGDITPAVAKIATVAIIGRGNMSRCIQQGLPKGLSQLPENIPNIEAGGTFGSC